MVRRGARRRYRRELLMMTLSALLLAYMSGLLVLTVAWGTSYSIFQWVVIGVMVVGSALLLAFQARKVIRIRGSRPGRRGE
ncbi:hypothetical protein ACTJKH_09310 [Microbacterium sp. 22215]|uniref:hypothetical protein n=1 Tax=Microbacterium sp. 22215 TaxID=3453893 RepID=UPI003F8338A3